MGISPSKPELVEAGFDGESGDYNVDASYKPGFGAEWLVGPNDVRILEKELRELDEVGDNVPEFKIDRVVAAKCIKVYDGDTAHFAVKNDGAWTRFRCRMLGYNSAEIRSRAGYKASEEEKKRGIEDRDFLASLLQDKKVILRLHKTDKYGRPLTDVYLVPSLDEGHHIDPEELFTNPEYHVNSIMIRTGHGVPYPPPQHTVAGNR